MAITEINVGTVANDGTGDTLRASFTIHNDNFTDSANAAAKLTQTSAADTTTDRAVLTDALGDNGGPIFTEGNLNVDTFGVDVSTRYIAEGTYRNDSGIIRFINPLNSFSDPSGMSVTGTFDVFRVDTVSVIETGVSVSDMNFITSSSSRFLVFDVINLSGIAAGVKYVLRAESASSQIEATF